MITIITCEVVRVILCLVKLSPAGESYTIKKYMIAEKDIVTKKYLKSQLDPIKGEFTKIHNEFGVLRLEIKEMLASNKVSIIKETRAIIHQSITDATENMKCHYDMLLERHIGAMIEEFREENKSFRDGHRAHTEKLENHEIRLERAGI